MFMLKLPEQIREIKRHHSYDRKHMISEWTGLTNGKMRSKCLMDKLRNNVYDTNWQWLMETVIDEMNHRFFPDKKEEQFKHRVEKLLDWEQIYMPPNVQRRDFIHNTDGKYNPKHISELQRLLWAVLVSGCECLEYIPHEDPHDDDQDDPDSLFQWN